MPHEHTALTRQSRLKVSETHDGRVARIRLDAPPDNALDVTVLTELVRALDAVATWPNLACVIFEAQGRDFSTGLALVQRRQPYVEVLLPALHLVARKLASLEAVLVTLVRGRCFGAAFELSLLSHAVIGDATVKFCLPELGLGTFPPLASLLLPERIGRARAEELLLSGRVMEHEEALSWNLLTACAGGWEDLDSLANNWVQKNVLSRSNVALRALHKATRRSLADRLGHELADLETLYLQHVAHSRDAQEGIDAALHRRTPRWVHG